MTATLRRTRRRFALAAVIAAAVTIVFATVGDGVAAPEATGLRLVIVEAGHTAVWALLSAAFTIAAVRARWTTPSQIVAVSAGILYVVFLLAVFVWR